MWETLIGGIIVIISIYIGHRLGIKEFQSKRLFDTKFKALQDINAIMVDTFFKINRYANNLPQNLEEYRKEVQKPKEKFENTLNRESIWLDEKLEKLLYEVRGAFIQMTNVMYFRITERKTEGKFEWINFTDKYRKARALIRQTLGLEKKKRWWQFWRR